MRKYVQTKMRVVTKKTIELRFGDETPVYLFAGDTVISLAEAHLKILEWIDSRKIFPVLNSDDLVEKVVTSIKEGKYSVGNNEIAIQDVLLARRLWKNLKGYLAPLGDDFVAEAVLRSVKDFWSVMSMRFGLFLDGKDLPRGYVVQEHDLSEVLSVKK